MHRKWFIRELLSCAAPAASAPKQLSRHMQTFRIGSPPMDLLNVRVLGYIVHMDSRTDAVSPATVSFTLDDTTGTIEAQLPRALLSCHTVQPCAGDCIDVMGSLRCKERLEVLWIVDLCTVGLT